MSKFSFRSVIIVILSFLALILSGLILLSFSPTATTKLVSIVNNVINKQRLIIPQQEIVAPPEKIITTQSDTRFKVAGTVVKSPWSEKGVGKMTVLLTEKPFLGKTAEIVFGNTDHAYGWGESDIRDNAIEQWRNASFAEIADNLKPNDSAEVWIIKTIKEPSDCTDLCQELKILVEKFKTGNEAFVEGKNMNQILIGPVVQILVIKI